MAETPKLHSPAARAVTVTPSNTVDLVEQAAYLYIGSAGDLKVDMARNAAGNPVTFKNVPVGIFPFRVTRVYLTGTGAGDIVAAWS